MKGQIKFLLIAIAATLLLSVAAAHAGGTTYYYPSQDNKAFSVTAPDDWEATPGEEEGDFFTLTGPSGLALSFRAIDASEKDAGKDAGEYIKETYKNVQMKEPFECQLGGMKGQCVLGTGESEDGAKYAFEVAWLVLKNGQIAELWTEVEMGDKEGAPVAKGILESFKAY